MDDAANGAVNDPFVPLARPPGFDSLSKATGKTMPRATAMAMSSSLMAMGGSMAVDPHWKAGGSGGAPALGGVSSLRDRFLSGKRMPSAPPSETSADDGAPADPPSPSEAGAMVILEDAEAPVPGDGTHWFLKNVPPAEVKKRLVRLVVQGVPGEFVVYKSESEPKCFGLTVKDGTGVFRNFVVKPAGRTGFCLREREAVVHKTVSALMEHLVAGDWDTSLLENGEGKLGVALRYPPGMLKATPGTRPHGEVVQNPLYRSARATADASADADPLGEMADMAAGYLDYGAGDDDDAVSLDELDIFSNQDSVGLAPEDPAEAVTMSLMTARELENETLARLHRAEALYDALYGPAGANGAAPAAALGLGLGDTEPSGRVRSLQREIAIVNATLKSHSDTRAKVHVKRTRLEEQFLIKQNELRQLVMTREAAEAKFAVRKNRAAQLEELDRAIKANLEKKNTALEQLVRQMGGAEVKIVQKKEGMIKLSGEGHMRKAALEHDKSQIQSLSEQLRAVTGSLHARHDDFKRYRSELVTVRHLLKNESQKQSDLSLQQHVSDRTIVATRTRVGELTNRAKVASDKIQSHRDKMHKLRSDEIKLIHQLESLGHRHVASTPHNRVSIDRSELDQYLGAYDLNNGAGGSTLAAQLGAPGSGRKSGQRSGGRRASAQPRLGTGMSPPVALNFSGMSANPATTSTPAGRRSHQRRPPSSGGGNRRRPAPSAIDAELKRLQAEIALTKEEFALAALQL